MLAASRLNPSAIKSVAINIHKTPGSSRVGSGENACAFVPQVRLAASPGLPASVFCVCVCVALFLDTPSPPPPPWPHGSVRRRAAQHYFNAVNGLKTDFDAMELNWCVARQPTQLSPSPENRPVLPTCLLPLGSPHQSLNAPTPPGRRDVSQSFFSSIQPNGILKPGLYTNKTGTYDLGAPAQASGHPCHP
jgi:hypothetical protein